MRKVAASLFISLDGVTESPDQWQFDNFDEDMMQEMGAQLGKQDATLLGRVTYQEWKDYWPNSSDEPFASYINHSPKYVFSTTLDSVEWGAHNTITLLKGDLTDEINKLKALPGRTIGVAGSPTLVRSLLENDVLDELILLVHPVIVGQGKRLYEDWSGLKRMKLADNRATRTGVAILSYVPRRE